MVRRMTLLSGAAVAMALAACGAPDEAAETPAPVQSAEADPAAAPAGPDRMIETPAGQTAPFTQALHDDPPYRAEHDLLWLMENIMQPAADVFWGSAGFVIDADGEHNLRPTTEEGWADVVTHAAIVAEMGNLLMTPIYSADKGDDWFQYADSLVGIGMRAQAAAEARDEEMIFDVGATMDRVCEGCHIGYMDPDKIYDPIGLPSAADVSDDSQANDLPNAAEQSDDRADDGIQ